MQGMSLLVRYKQSPRHPPRAFPQVVARRVTADKIAFPPDLPTPVPRNRGGGGGSRRVARGGTRGGWLSRRVNSPAREPSVLWRLATGWRRFSRHRKWLRPLPRAKGESANRGRSEAVVSRIQRPRPPFSAVPPRLPRR